MAKQHGLDELKTASLAGWDANAAFIDAELGDAGDEWHRDLVGPVVERLLGLRSGQRLLEIACGTGIFARRMALSGIEVTASDFSAAMVVKAQARSGELADRIRYDVIDATDPRALASIEGGPFDAALCNMSIFAMPELTPMYAAVFEQVAPGGAFVVSTLHPAFRTTLPRVGETELPQVGMVPAVEVARYRSPFVTRGVAVIGQPEPQFYFHRPLEVLFGEPLSCGWVCDAVEEPSLPAGMRGPEAERWGKLPEFPPLLILRFRKPE